MFGRKNRIDQIDRMLAEIAQTGDLSRRVSVGGHDDISRLTRSLNMMLSALEKWFSRIKDSALKERGIRKIFQKYVPHEVIEAFFQEPTEEQLPSTEDRMLVVLFCNVNGFIEMCQTMSSDELVESLNAYFGMMVDIIGARKGLVYKYFGAEILAFFGALIKHDDDAENSVRASMDMVKALKAFNDNQKKAGKPTFNIGVGINYGITAVGRIGTNQKSEFTVIGGVVNVAPILASLTSAYAVPILVSDAVVSKIKGDIKFRVVDRVTIKGDWRGTLTLYVPAVELLPSVEQAWRIHDEAVSLYYKRQFKEAAAMFKMIGEIIPKDAISRRYLIRCNRYGQDPPPPEWQGYVPIVSTGPILSE